MSVSTEVQRWTETKKEEEHAKDHTVSLPIYFPCRKVCVASVLGWEAVQSTEPVVSTSMRT